MKKINFVIFGAIAYCIFLFVYHYQAPLLTSSEAFILAVDYLQNPPEEFGDPFHSFEIEGFQYEQYRAQLMPKRGFVAEMLNHREWAVTIYYEGMEPIVVMDAVTGELLRIEGPLN